MSPGPNLVSSVRLARGNSQISFLSVLELECNTKSVQGAVLWLLQIFMKLPQPYQKLCLRLIQVSEAS